MISGPTFWNIKRQSFDGVQVASLGVFPSLQAHPKEKSKKKKENMLIVETIPIANRLRRVQLLSNPIFRELLDEILLKDK